jgi:hypothetical protein
MDVQGAESLVLNGAKEMLPAILSIWLEVADKEMYRGQKLRAEIETFMCENGFILAFGASHWGGVEGDQFYVNGRDPRALAYLRARRFSQFLAAAGRFPGRVWRRLKSIARRVLGQK